MRPLSAHQILQIWEIGQGQHPLDRALTLLRFAYPERSSAELASLSIGQRDAHLLTLRELTFGSQLTGSAECSRCKERLEFALNAADIRLIDATDTASSKVQTYSLTLAEFELELRLPNSWDLAALVRARATPSPWLLQRCLLKASRQGSSVTYAELPPQVLEQLVEQMTEWDPQAEIQLNLECPACQHRWSALFDILSFFWTELGVQAKRLLREVHTLARFYGWREADILAMSPLRRQFYLDLVSG
ncbi:phage baseplate protein [Leptolyngbya sp. FACHB-261]|uniref:T4 family baseplate hub assembly chaperone n=1 Tax=Leptolyngbya sp. FACHB-261 TaxID=2692806 RepID=UPI001684C54F|nr:phage baseplate protein [Leptolyngbya sp. FACHB-261]MBD2102593.1 phage baseplate protein [Leptolyngbya sp. FACHB-261]